MSGSTTSAATVAAAAAATATISATATLFINATAEDEAALAEVLGPLEQDGFIVHSAPPVDLLSQALDDLQSTAASAGIVTVWSRTSILDEVVVSKAELALQAHCLIPVRIDDVAAPIGFRQAQTYDIVRLTHESGVNLARQLRGRYQSDRVTAPVDARRLASLRLRAAEWALFVIPPVTIYWLVLTWLMHGMSEYVTFVFAAFIAVDTALVGVPRFLDARGVPGAIEKLTHCTRVDLGLQALLGVLISAAAQVGDFFGSGGAWIVLLLLLHLAATAIALLLRYLGIGLWLLSREPRAQVGPLAILWVLFLVPPAIAYAGALRMLLGYSTDLTCVFVGAAAAQTLVFGVPGFWRLSAERWNVIRQGALSVTLADVVLQSLVSLGEGLFMHSAVGTSLAQGVVRLAMCAAIGIGVRYGCVRGWMTLRRSHA